MLRNEVNHCQKERKKLLRVNTEDYYIFLLGYEKEKSWFEFSFGGI